MVSRVYISENAFIACIAAWRLGQRKVAIVIGTTIYLHNCPRSEFLENKQWLCHELQHVQQYQRLGIFRFLVLYVYYSLRFGYQKNPFEIEARANENNLQLLDGLIVD